MTGARARAGPNDSGCHVLGFFFFVFFVFFFFFWLFLGCFFVTLRFFWFVMLVFGVFLVFSGFFSKSLLYGFFKPLFFGYLFGVFLDFFCHFWGFLIFFCILVGPF